jgi:hypothetical protein
MSEPTTRLPTAYEHKTAQVGSASGTASGKRARPRGGVA